jgi:hypothetical protein
MSFLFGQPKLDSHGLQSCIEWLGKHKLYHLCRRSNLLLVLVTFPFYHPSFKNLSDISILYHRPRRDNEIFIR